MGQIIKRTINYRSRNIHIHSHLALHEHCVCCMSQQILCFRSVACVGVLGIACHRRNTKLCFQDPNKRRSRCRTVAACFIRLDPDVFLSAVPQTTASRMRKYGICLSKSSAFAWYLLLLASRKLTPLPASLCVP